jgi:hypothetical protein
MRQHTHLARFTRACRLTQSATLRRFDPVVFHSCVLQRGAPPCEMLRRPPRRGVLRHDQGVVPPCTSEQRNNWASPRPPAGHLADGRRASGFWLLQRSGWGQRAAPSSGMDAPLKSRIWAVAHLRGSFCRHEPNESQPLPALRCSRYHLSAPAKSTSAVRIARIDLPERGGASLSPASDAAGGWAELRCCAGSRAVASVG